MSLGVLAERAGVNKSTLSRWEAGKTKPSIRELTCVFDTLETPESLRRYCLQQLNLPRSERHLSTIVPSAAESKVLPVSGGELLRALRLRAGVTQADAARRIGVTQGILSRWEHNDCWPERESLQRLCTTLNATAGETQGLIDHAWKNHDELPSDDKDQLDACLHRLKWDDTMTDRDLIYLVFAGRYATLRRQRKITELEALEVWGAYACHLSSQRRIKEAIQMAKPIFQAIHHSTGVLTQGQLEGLLAITNNLTSDRIKGNQPDKKYFPTRQILQRFNDRIPPPLLGRWQDAMGMITWHCGRSGRLPALIAQSDAYYEQSAQSEATPTGQRARRQRFARIMCHQGRYEEALCQLERAAALPSDPRIGRQVEHEQVLAWALVGLGDKQGATRHLNQADNLLLGHPDFLERSDYFDLKKGIVDFIETGKKIL